MCYNDDIINYMKGTGVNHCYICGKERSCWNGLVDELAIFEISARNVLLLRMPMGYAYFSEPQILADFRQKVKHRLVGDYLSDVLDRRALSAGIPGPGFFKKE